MKKIVTSIILIYVLLMILAPILVSAQAIGSTPLVPCGTNCKCDANKNCTGCCTITDIFKMVGLVYRFIVWDIATPLAIIAILAGGIMLMISAGNPGLAGKGRSILTVAAIGIALVFCSWLIVNAILLAIGAPGL